MIRTIAKVALANYDRWYIIAHSQGTVAAFNGLMETPYAWPGYFTREEWEEMRASGLCGDGIVPPLPNPTMPRRPVWAGPDEVAYRARIFGRFRGLLTLGSPLEKFAAIWPARVPISRLPAFRENTVWINVLDPLDPVSGLLRAYRGHPTALCPPPQDVGYAAASILLLAHLRYLTRTARGYLSDGIVHWLLTGDSRHVTTGLGRFAPYNARYRRRRALAVLVVVRGIHAPRAGRGLDHPWILDVVDGGELRLYAAAWIHRSADGLVRMVAAAGIVLLGGGRVRHLGHRYDCCRHHLAAPLPRRRGSATTR